jgi:hypothetical protein
MQIKRKKDGKIFECSKHEWENVVMQNGVSDRYEVINDDSPIELKSFTVIKKTDTNKKN